MGGGPVNTRKDAIRDTMQIRSLKDEECSDRRTLEGRKGLVHSHRNIPISQLGRMHNVREVNYSMPVVTT
jgi:hypothetical protein